MPQQRDKILSSITELPNPELNPLLNPTLGRNLGRWAEVYFTTSPEKREEAVEELLRELQGEPADGPVDGPPATTQLNVEPAAIETPMYAQTCPGCGQAFAIPQRFCGMCGTALLARPSDFETRPMVQPRSVPEETAALRYAPSGSLLGLDSHDSAPDVSGTKDVSDISWLREKHLAADLPRSTASSSWVRRVAPAGLAALAIAALFYAQAKPRKPALPASQPVSVPSAQNALSTQQTTTDAANASAREAAKPALPLASEAVESSRSATQTATPARNVASSRVDDPNSALENSRPQAAQNAAGPAGSLPPDATDNPGAGAAEVVQAEKFLEGKNSTRDPSAAARLLWSAVGKENTSAILLLSDMYLMGDGVPKSCDQAKILLYAAARKHVAQAADKLRNLEQSGCP